MKPLCALFVLAALSTARAEPRDVEIKANDGTVLKGTYFAAAKPGPAVLLLHMCNSNRKAWAGLAPLLVAKGIHVLSVDYRGYGQSGGAPYTKWTEAERLRMTSEVWPGDLDRAFAFLLEQPGVDRARIGAAGGSCGVNNAVQLARRHPEVKTLVLLAGTTDGAGEAFLARAPWLPIFATAARDDGDAVETTGWTVGFSSNPENHLEAYEKGGHGTNLFPAHKELEPMIAAWFERHLVLAPVKAVPGPAKPGPSAALAAKVRDPKEVARAREELRRGGKPALPPEGALNGLGYELLQAGRLDDAIAVLSLNAEAHPDSANTYDSLADAYVVAKDRAKALEFARKALAALPGDRRADAELKKMIRASAEAKLRDAK